MPNRRIACSLVLTTLLAPAVQSNAEAQKDEGAVPWCRSRIYACHWSYGEKFHPNANVFQTSGPKDSGLRAPLLTTSRLQECAAIALPQFGHANFSKRRDLF